MAKVQAPSGFRDFLPGDFRKRSELIRRIREVYESFGYEGIETPAVENLAVLTGKGGGENEKLMFRVLKRGAELQRALEKQDELADLALRFDLTVPLARYYAAHRAELPAVFKRYHIGPVWRAERAQYGRFREFIQCDVDVLGSPSMLVEAEVILATTSALAALGFRGLKVRLNSKPLLHCLVRSRGVPQEHVAAVVRWIDKLDKETEGDPARELVELGLSAEAVANLRAMFVAPGGQDGGKLTPEDVKSENLKKLSALAEQLNSAGALDPDARRQIEDLQRIVESCPALPSGYLWVDFSLARGMDYYTGPIFEVAAEGVPFSLAGGGRYDELLGTLAGVKVPACGFSIGFERVYTLMVERGMFGGAARAADALVTVPSPEVAGEALALAAELRAAGLRVDFFPGTAKLQQQFETAEKKGIAWAVIPDAQELAKGCVNVRELAVRKNTSVPRGEVAAWLRGKMGQ